MVLRYAVRIRSLLFQRCSSCPECAGDALQIDAVVLEEALVLDRDDRLPHDRSDVVRAHEDAALVASQDGQDRASVRRVDDRVDVRVLRGRVELWDLTRDGPDEPEREGQERGDEQDEQQCRKPTLANPASRTRRPLLAPTPQEGGF
jgi:hypothetical protein